MNFMVNDTDVKGFGRLRPQVVDIVHVIWIVFHSSGSCVFVKRIQTALARSLSPIVATGIQVLGIH